MFVTMPQFEQTGMSKVAGGGQKYWLAITASALARHWYLFNYEAQVLDARVDLTLHVAWEETLLKLMELVPEQDRRAVYRVDRRDAGRLIFRNVQAIWKAASDEEREGLVAVLAIDGERELVDPQLHPVARLRERQLVFQSAAPASEFDRCEAE